MWLCAALFVCVVFFTVSRPVVGLKLWEPSWVGNWRDEQVGLSVSVGWFTSSQDQNTRKPHSIHLKGQETHDSVRLHTIYRQEFKMLHIIVNVDEHSFPYYVNIYVKVLFKSKILHLLSAFHWHSGLKPWVYHKNWTNENQTTCISYH